MGGAVNAVCCEKDQISHFCVKVSLLAILGEKSGPDQNRGYTWGGAVSAEFCESTNTSPAHVYE